MNKEEHKIPIIEVIKKERREYYYDRQDEIFCYYVFKEFINSDISLIDEIKIQKSLLNF